MIPSITTGKGTIAFGQKDLFPGDSPYNSALYLIMTCLHKYVSIALVGYWSAMNMCP